LNFFKNGYAVIYQDTALLKKEVESAVFGKETGKYGSDLTQTFKLNPSTQPATGVLQNFKSHSFFIELLKAYGNFSTTHIMVHRYKKSNAMNWHHDVFDRSIVLALAYISDDSFTEIDGGVLEIGRCCVDSSGTPIGQPIVVSRHLPNTGVIVLINNTDPTLLHRVTPVTTQKIRTVVSCQLGFSDMTMVK